MSLLLRVGIVVIIAVVAACGVGVYNAFTMFAPPDSVVTTTPVPNLGTLRETFAVQPGLPDSWMTCTYELQHDDGRRIELGSLGSEDRRCELQRAPVVDQGALVLMSNIGYIVWRDGSSAHVITDNCRLLVGDSTDAKGAATCLFALEPRLELGEAGEPWRLHARNDVQFTSTDNGKTWQPATAFARLR